VGKLKNNRIIAGPEKENNKWVITCYRFTFVKFSCIYFQITVRGINPFQPFPSPPLPLILSREYFNSAAFDPSVTGTIPLKLRQSLLRWRNLIDFFYLLFWQNISEIKFNQKSKYGSHTITINTFLIYLQ